MSGFSEREQQVLRLLATTGATDPEIGRELCMSPKTVKAHVSSMLRKTGYRNRTELTIHAWRSGWMELEEVMS